LALARLGAVARAISESRAGATPQNHWRKKSEGGRNLAFAQFLRSLIPHLMQDLEFEILVV
tara:strand:- start:288 stop:470 length:183 start_codon:yes stop_codon:yes gene_type:complete